MKISTCIAAIFSLSLLPHAHALSLEQVQQQLTSHSVIRAHFQQQRSIKTMPQPLNSSGEMVIARDTGLLWQQQKPFAMRLVLQKDKMIQQMQGQPAQIITAQSNPQMFQFNHLLTALFTADRDKLEKNFTITFAPINNTAWQLQLTPISSPLDKLFDSIDILGEKYIDQVVLKDKQGDKTTLLFSQQRTIPQILTPQEQADFELP